MWRCTAAALTRARARRRSACGLGREAITVQADIAVWDDVQRLAREVVDHFGRIDVLVNNVGDMAATQMSGES